MMQKTKEKKELLLKEIEARKKDFHHAKREKVNVKRLLSKDLELLTSQNVDPEDSVYKEKVNKSAEQLNMYNQIMKDAQSQIKSKEEALKKINGISFDPHDQEMKTNESAMKTDGL